MLKQKVVQFKVDEKYSKPSPPVNNMLYLGFDRLGRAGIGQEYAAIVLSPKYEKDVERLVLDSDLEGKISEDALLNRVDELALYAHNSLYAPEDSLSMKRMGKTLDAIDPFLFAYAVLRHASLNGEFELDLFTENPYNWPRPAESSNMGVQKDLLEDQLIESKDELTSDSEVHYLSRLRLGLALKYELGRINEDVDVLSKDIKNIRMYFWTPKGNYWQSLLNSLGEFYQEAFIMLDKSLVEKDYDYLEKGLVPTLNLKLNNVHENYYYEEQLSNFRKTETALRKIQGFVSENKELLKVQNGHKFIVDGDSSTPKYLVVPQEQPPQLTIGSELLENENGHYDTAKLKESYNAMTELATLYYEATSSITATNIPSMWSIIKMADQISKGNRDFFKLSKFQKNKPKKISLKRKIMNAIGMGNSSSKQKQLK